MATMSFGIVWHSYKNTIFSDALIVARSDGGEHVSSCTRVYNGVIGKQIKRGEW